MQTLSEFLSSMADSVAASLGRLHVSPMVLTLASVPVGLAAAISVGLGYFVLGGSLFLAAGILDTLDGRLARKTKTVSRLGAVTDSTVDRVVDLAFLGGIVLAYRSDPVVVITAIAAMIFTSLISYERLMIERLAGNVPGGFWQRPERIVLMGVGGLASNYPVAVLILAVGTLITAAGRFEMALRIASAMDANPPRSVEEFRTWPWLRRGSPVYVAIALLLGAVVVFVRF